jgi:hypothetical protein
MKIISLNSLHHLPVKNELFNYVKVCDDQKYLGRSSKRWERKLFYTKCQNVSLKVEDNLIIMNLKDSVNINILRCEVLNLN